METVRIKTQPNTGNLSGIVIINKDDLTPDMVLADDTADEIKQPTLTKKTGKDHGR